MRGMRQGEIWMDASEQVNKPNYNKFDYAEEKKNCIKL